MFIRLFFNCHSVGFRLPLKINMVVVALLRAIRFELCFQLQTFGPREATNYFGREIFRP